MSRLRIGHGPDDWKPEDPATPHRSPGSYTTAENVGNMRPILRQGQYLENRHRVKPPNPLSLHPENRR